MPTPIPHILAKIGANVIVIREVVELYVHSIYSPHLRRVFTYNRLHWYC